MQSKTMQLNLNQKRRQFHPESGVGLGEEEEQVILELNLKLSMLRKRSQSWPKRQEATDEAEGAMLLQKRVWKQAQNHRQAEQVAGIRWLK